MTAAQRWALAAAAGLVLVLGAVALSLHLRLRALDAEHQAMSAAADDAQRRLDMAEELSERLLQEIEGIAAADSRAEAGPPPRGRLALVGSRASDGRERAALIQALRRRGYEVVDAPAPGVEATVLLPDAARTDPQAVDAALRAGAPLLDEDDLQGLLLADE